MKSIKGFIYMDVRIRGKNFIRTAKCVIYTFFGSNELF